MALWKYFDSSPQISRISQGGPECADLPELKINKPSDTRWLTYERCVKSCEGQVTYAAIVVPLDNIHENTHEPEALGHSKSLSKR